MGKRGWNGCAAAARGGIPRARGGAEHAKLSWVQTRRRKAMTSYGSNEAEALVALDSRSKRRYPSFVGNDGCTVPVGACS
jgi:hypothetical protein